MVTGLFTLERIRLEVLKHVGSRKCLLIQRYILDSSIYYRNNFIWYIFMVNVTIFLKLHAILNLVPCNKILQETKQYIKKKSDLA